MRNPRLRTVARRWLVGIASFAVAASLVVAPSWGESSAEAADLSKFQAGNIISDAVFFNSGSMSQAQVQSFLVGKNPNCAAGAICINNYTQSTYTRSGDVMCKQYTGATNERASAIIKKVADACGINPQVLLVTLQKEQTLITMGAPAGSARWKIAMGYACPDTAACDSRYFGFYNQVYMAAWQLKRYGNPPGTSQFFTWFPVGGYANVQFNPSSSCGSSRVFIANKATAALYYYTPYQPNAAAIAAGYGVGNSCSAYGNRNFYQFFTDWFGSTQVGGGNGGGTNPGGGASSSFLQKASDGNDIFLVSGSTKYHVVSMADYNMFAAKLGSYASVSSSTLNGYSTSPKKAGILMLNESNGEVVLIDNGQYHRFASCGLVATWGYACGDAIAVSNTLLSKFGKGAEMAPFAKRGGSGATFWIDGGKRYQMKNAAAEKAFYNNKAPYVATMRAGVFDKLGNTGRTLVAPNTLVRGPGNGDVFYVTGVNARHKVTQTKLAAEYGIPGAITSVSAAELNGYSAGPNLSLFARCGSTNYVANGGKITNTGSASLGGFTPVTLDGRACSLLKKESGSLNTKSVFVKDASSNRVYVPQSSALRWVRTGAMETTLNGGKNRPKAVTVSTEARSTLKTGPSAIIPGHLYRADGDSVVYYITDSKTRVRLPTFGHAKDAGIGTAFTQIAPSTMNETKRVNPDLGLFLSCNGTTYLMHGGKGTRFTGGLPSGFPARSIDGTACGRVTADGTSMSGNVFVMKSGNPDVYQLTGGKARKVTSYDRLLRINGGKTPRFITIDGGTLASLPKGANL